MNSSDQEIKKLTPPYLSVSKLERTFELVSGRNFSEISIQTFMSYGFGKIDAQLAVSMLRFLGFINDEGKATELMVKLRLNGEPRKKAFETIIKEAYEKLFAVVPEPQKLTASELLQDFRVHYDLSERVAKAVVPAFIKLCEFGGLKEEGSIIGRKREPKTKSAEPTAKNKSAASSQKIVLGKVIGKAPEGADLTPYITIPLSDDISVKISFELNNRLLLDDKLNEKWLAARKIFKAFAEEATQKEKTEPKTESE